MKNVFTLFGKSINSNIFFFILLTGIVFSLYGKARDYEFIYLDDTRLVSSNINFISDIKNLPKLFVKSCYYTTDTKDGYYRPVLSLSFALEVLLFGESSKVSHTTNIILYILSIYLMYVFLLKLNLNRIILKLSLLLLAVHPALASVSAWIAARNDSLLAVFVFLTLISFVSYIEKNKISYFWLTVYFFAVSIFTKESGVVLIILFPVLLCCLSKFEFKNILKLYSAFLGIFIIYFILRKFVGISSWFSFNLKNVVIMLKNIFIGFVIYINKLLIPADVPVCLFDFLPGIFSVAVAAACVIFLIIVYYKNFVNRKFLLFGISFFIFYLLPTFFILQNLILFHRLLLPSAGMVLIFVLLIQKIIKCYPISKKYFLFLFAILFIIFVRGSYIQADKFKDNTAFTVNGYKSAPSYHVFLNGIAGIYTDMKDYDNALIFLYKAEEYYNGYYINNIATMLLYQKKFDQAEVLLKKSININRHKEIAYANLSLLYEEKQDYKKSLEYAKKAYDENPYNIDLSVNLARKYYLNKQYEQAIKIYKDLLKIKKDAGYYYSIGVLYDKLNSKEQAFEYANKAVDLDGRNEKYRNFAKHLAVKDI